jgi:hypothetical protein
MQFLALDLVPGALQGHFLEHTINLFIIHLAQH